MTLLLANGQPKSASTFVCQVAFALSEKINGVSYNPFHENVWGEGWFYFMRDIETSTYDRIKEGLKPDQVFVVKTHSMPNADLTPLFKSGHMKCLFTFRDPRDAALALMDKGRFERETGSTRHFWRFETIKDCGKPVKRSLKSLKQWAEMPNTLLIPYHFVARQQNLVIELVSQFMGLEETSEDLFRYISSNFESFPEFNKGKADRFIDDLTPADIHFANEHWKEAIELYDKYFIEIAEKINLADIARDTLVTRDERLREKLAE